MSPKPRSDVLVAAMAVFGAIGVMAGAFGAHSLRDILETSGTAEVWRTAVFYNLVHAVAGITAAPMRARFGSGPIWLWVAGVILFSGSLYLLALGGPRWLGPVTPIGGALLIAGWLWLAFGALRKREGID
jgi:uncharacterized membrane protein YgdD (TMEM256/DUF423 family)